MEVAKLNASIRHLSMPRRMQRRPLDDRGYPVPFFVAKVDGKWDFRAMDGQRVADCYNKRLCWLCGEKLGQYLAFTIGPMCSVNRINSEPPSHLECAEYAVRACPFLSHPRMRRNEVELPGGTVAGIHLDHNPGATAIWITKSYRPKRVENGILFELGEPTNVLWYTEGRPATRGEVLAAMYKGLPRLQELAETEHEHAELLVAVSRAMYWLPKEDDDARPVRLCEPSGEGVRGIGEGSGEGGAADSG